MVFTAVIFFLIAAFLGAFLFRRLINNLPTSKPVVFMHGTIAGIALLCLLVYVALGHTAPLLLTSVSLFILAALGGFTMFVFDTTGKRVPRMLLIGHPILAITSVVLLIMYIVQEVRT